MPNRQALKGVVFVLKTGVPWQSLPTEMGCGSGSTCWRRFSELTALSVWSKLHALLLSRLAESELSVLTRQSLDRRIASLSEVENESAAWTADRNERQVGVDWQSTIADARVKLKHLYPKILA